MLRFIMMLAATAAVGLGLTAASTSASATWDWKNGGGHHKVVAGNEWKTDPCGKAKAC